MRHENAKWVEVNRLERQWAGICGVLSAVSQEIDRREEISDDLKLALTRVGDIGERFQRENGVLAKKQYLESLKITVRQIVEEVYPEGSERDALIEELSEIEIG